MCVHLTLERWTSVMKGNSSVCFLFRSSVAWLCTCQIFTPVGGDAVCFHSDPCNIYRSVATPIHSVDASLSPNLLAIELQFAECAAPSKYLQSASGFVCEQHNHWFLLPIRQPFDQSKLCVLFEWKTLW